MPQRHEGTRTSRRRGKGSHPLGWRPLLLSLVDGVPVLWPQPRLPSAGEWLAGVLFVVSAQLGPHGVGPPRGGGDRREPRRVPYVGELARYPLNHCTADRWAAHLIPNCVLMDKFGRREMLQTLAVNLRKGGGPWL